MYLIGKVIVSKSNPKALSAASSLIWFVQSLQNIVLSSLKKNQSFDNENA